MKRFTFIKLLALAMLFGASADVDAQLVKSIKFSKAEGYKDGPLFGQPSGDASVWASVSLNKGESVFTDGEVVLSVTNETLFVHPDHSGTELGVIYFTLPIPAQTKGPITVTWDWQFFPTNEIPADYDPTNNNYNAQLQGTDFGFTISDSENRMVDGDPFAVFNELSTPNRMGALCDARNGTGDCDGGGTWLNFGPEYKDGKKLHMKLIAYFGDEADPYNNTFDVYAQREGEEEWKTSDHSYMRRCPTGKGLDCITMWLNNGDIETRIVVDNIRIVGPIPVADVPTIGIEKTAAGVRITYTGTLQSAETAQGPYNDVSGASSPLELPAGLGAKFFRSKN